MTLSNRKRLLMGLTLFSMFFGAGNLIFPPFLAYQAGSVTWFAMVGFCVSAIGFPILGVIAIAKSGGLDALARRVSPIFAQVFVLLAYVSIGPGLAIPRTAATSFSMAVPPFVPEQANMHLLQLIYSAVFFSVAVFVALRPEKLSQRLGKVMTPILLLLIAVVLAGCLFTPGNGYGSVSGPYVSHAPIVGFLDGYQTMDAIAALNFGFIIALNIRELGVTDQKQIVGETIHAGWLAGALLLAAYCALAHIGGIASGMVEGAADGAAALTGMVGVLYGRLGNGILAVIFIIACLNTCIGLLTCCSDYFHKIAPKISYQAWLIFFAITSMIVSNAGLNAILSVSVPILGAIYPVCILLILLGICHHWIERFWAVYPVSVLLTSVVSIAAALKDLGWLPAFLVKALQTLPLAKQGLPWLLPAVIGIIIGIVVSLVVPKKAK